MSHVTFNTSKGEIIIELYFDEAPISAKNFYDYAKKGFYNGTIFHRVIPNFVIQGGGMESNMQEKETKEAIPNEANNGLKNEKGTLSMARTMDPDSATSQFFINLVSNDFLDFKSETNEGWGYAVFGKVTSGMQVVEEIAKVKTGNIMGHQDVPVDNIVISSTTVTKL